MLGVLLEKEITTPEYYPLTLNALVNGCNQKSNRLPAVQYDEETVEEAIASLRQKLLVVPFSGPGSRAVKYAHQLPSLLNLGRRELALLCELMLRGPQTTGELRDRADRMHHFTDLEEVEARLQELIEREPDPLVTLLPRQAGMKEQRYAHLLGGPVEAGFSAQGAPAPTTATAGVGDRIAALEEEVRSLRIELLELRTEWASFRRQFE